tara:strand:+ start:1132 stop:1380 length:249 start_codon:yes stop_codon:yes gene_type:complete
VIRQVIRIASDKPSIIPYSELFVKHDSATKNPVKPMAYWGRLGRFNEFSVNFCELIHILGDSLLTFVNICDIIMKKTVNNTL